MGCPVFHKTALLDIKYYLDTVLNLKLFNSMLKVLFIVLDLIDVLMHIKSVVLGNFDYAGSNVGAMV